MKVLSLFSGVGGFDLGLEAAGMETVFQCEWDKHANTILHKHWPTVPKWEDVSTLTGKHILANAPVIDVVAWGSPCQDLSVAGKRAGLEGGRSNLFHEGIRIIKELRKETNGQYPRISIWENVVGALNSNRGADFGVIIDEMAEAGALVIEWAVLDAQYFGVPQRRRRVFVIAIFDPAIANNCPDPLLPVSESLPGHLAKGKPAKQSVASKIADSVGTNGQWWDGKDTAEALTTTSNEQRMPDKHRFQAVVEEQPILIDRAAFNQGENALYQPHISDDPISPSLVAQGPHAVATSGQGDVRATTAIVFNDDRRIGPTIHGDTVSTLQAFMGTGGNNTPMVAQNIEPPMLLDIQRVGDIRVYTEPVQALQARMGTGGNSTPMLAFDTQFGSNANVTEEVSPTLKSSQALPSVAYGITGNAIGRQDHNGPNGPSHTPEGGLMFTLTSTDVHAVSQEEPTMAVRRLTPLECERLMGWPDDHTRYKADGTEQADSHRYKQAGNGVASPVAQWIGKHLIKLGQQ